MLSSPMTFDRQENFGNGVRLWQWRDECFKYLEFDPNKGE